MVRFSPDVHSFLLSTVQHECIPQAILGMDIICQAKSGMGKTAVFVLATLQQLEQIDGQVSVLVMCHTRELAFQISKEYERFSKYMNNIKVWSSDKKITGNNPTSASVTQCGQKTLCSLLTIIQFHMAHELPI